MRAAISSIQYLILIPLALVVTGAFLLSPFYEPLRSFNSRLIERIRNSKNFVDDSILALLAIFRVFKNRGLDLLEKPPIIILLAVLFFSFATLTAYWITLKNFYAGVELIGYYVGWTIIVMILMFFSRHAYIDALVILGIGLSWTFLVWSTIVHNLTIFQIVLLSAMFSPLAIANLMPFPMLFVFPPPKASRLRLLVDRGALTFGFGFRVKLQQQLGNTLSKHELQLIDLGEQFIFGFGLSILVTSLSLAIGQTSFPHASDVYVSWQLYLINWLFDGLTLAVTVAMLRRASEKTRYTDLVAYLIGTLSIGMIFAVMSLDLGLIGSGHEIPIGEEIRMLALFVLWPDKLVVNPYFWVMNSALIPTILYILIFVEMVSAKIGLNATEYVLLKIRARPNPKRLTSGVYGVLMAMLSFWYFVLEAMK